MNRCHYTKRNGANDVKVRVPTKMSDRGRAGGDY